MKALVVVIVAISTATPAAPFDPHHPTGTGAVIKFDAAEGDVARSFAAIADVSHMTIVLVDVPPTSVKLPPGDVPWDIAFGDLVTSAKLDAEVHGSVSVVASPEWIKAHTKKPAKYRGATASLYANDADSSAIGQLLSLATGEKIGIASGKHTVSMVAKRIPSDQVAELVMLQSDAAAAKPTSVSAPGAKCVATTTRSAALKLVAIAEAGIKRVALFVDDKGAPVFAVKGTCLGSDKAKLSDFHSRNSIDVDQGGATRTITFPI